MGIAGLMCYKHVEWLWLPYNPLLGPQTTRLTISLIFRNKTIFWLNIDQNGPQTHANCSTQNNPKQRNI